MSVVLNLRVRRRSLGGAQGATQDSEGVWALDWYALVAGTLFLAVYGRNRCLTCNTPQA